MSEQNQQNGAPTAPEKDLTEVLKVRREKLAALLADGENPFAITKFDRQNHAADNIEDYANFEGKTVVLAGRLM